MRPQFLIAFALAILLPSFAIAQTGLVPCTGPDCRACDLVTLADNIIKWLLIISVFVATILLAYAGIILVTSAGNTEAKSKMKSILWGVVIGFIIILAAWLGVDVFVKTLTGKGLSEYSLTCTEIPRPTSGGTTSSTNPPGTGSAGSAPVAANQLSHAQAAERLQAAGINVTSTGGAVQEVCTASGCTSLQGMNQATIDNIVAFKQNCNCTVTVTGGTETTGGHTCTGTMSHCSGYKIDIDDSPAVNSYIQNTYTQSANGTSGCGNNRQGGYCDPYGNEYVYETNHWDVLVTRGPAAGSGQGGAGGGGGGF